MKSIMLAVSSIVVAFCFVVMSWQFGSENSIATALQGYSVSVFVFILIGSTLDRRCSLLMIVVSYYHVAIFLVPGMLQSAQGWFPFFAATYNSEDIVYVSLFIALYSSSILGGYLLASSRTRALSVKSGLRLKEISDSKIIIGSVLSMVVSIACMAAIGLRPFLDRRRDVDLELNPSSLILLNLPRMASFCAAAILAERARASRSVFMLLLLIPMLLLTSIANNPFSIPRFDFFGFIFVLVYASGKFISPRSKVIFVGALVAGQVLVLPLVDTLSRGETGDEFKFDPFLYLSTHGDFDGLQSVLNTYLLVQKDGHSYGWQLLGSLLTFVPRDVWPTKAFATGQAAGEAMGFAFTNLSAPLPAEIYVDFGILGLLVIPFCIGYAGRLFDLRAHRAILSGAPMTVTAILWRRDRICHHRLPGISSGGPVSDLLVFWGSCNLVSFAHPLVDEVGPV